MGQVRTGLSSLAGDRLNTQSGKKTSTFRNPVFFFVFMRGLPGVGIKPGLQARAGVECRTRPTDAPTRTPRKTGPLLRYLSDNQAIKSACVCIIDPTEKSTHTMHHRPNGLLKYSQTKRRSIRGQPLRTQRGLPAVTSRRVPATPSGPYRLRG